MVIVRCTRPSKRRVTRPGEDERRRLASVDVADNEFREETAVPGLDRRRESDGTVGEVRNWRCRAVRSAEVEGEAGPGEKISQARDLAAELGVNTNTVLRALRVLRDEGLVEIGRGRSIRVTGRPQKSLLTAKLKEVVELARQQGYRRDELVAMLENLPST